MGVEILLTASPAYFRPNNAEEWGRYENNKVRAWTEQTINFLKSTYTDDRLVEVSLHLDEATPHIHAIVCPFVFFHRKKRRTKVQIKNKVDAETYPSTTLSAKSLFDRSNLVKLQTDYANALKPLGIKRGIKGSRAEHNSLANYYGLVNAPDLMRKPQAHYPVIEKPPLLNKDEWLSKTQQSLNKFIDDQLEAVVTSFNKLLKQANYLKTQLEVEKQRTSAYWEKFGSPQGVEDEISRLKIESSDWEKKYGAAESLLVDHVSSISDDSKLTTENKNLRAQIESLKEQNIAYRRELDSLKNNIRSRPQNKRS